MTNKAKSVHARAVNPVLIIIMRNDLDSLNAGKACAQASHAANHMVKTIKEGSSLYFKNSLHHWENEAKGFGTCIVLEGSWYNIEAAVDECNVEVPTIISAAKVLDPSYPLRDGEVTHAFPLHTCAWFFGDKEDLVSIRNSYELMP